MSKGVERFVFKIVVIGDGAVGKTSLIRRFTKAEFREEYVMTIGAQFSEYNHKIGEDQIKLMLWDIAGQDTFHFLRPAFYEGSNAAIIVYSLEESDSGKLSFDNIKNWHNDFKKNCGDLPVVLFGNKFDLIDEKSLDEKKVINLVDKRDLIGYYKTSAKTGDGVIKAFNAIINELYNKFKKNISKDEFSKSTT